jgi:hypothetical protein
MADRRLIGLLRWLASAPKRGEATIEEKFGERGLELLTKLQREGRAEHSTGAQTFWWLTSAGKSLARPYLNKKPEAAA